VLREFAKRGLSINEGIAVDARLVKSASKPMGNDDLRGGRREGVHLRVRWIRMVRC